MKDVVLKALNEQIHMELESAYTYLAMAAHFEDRSLPGFAGWMRQQAREEVAHAMRLFEHVVDRSGRVVLKAVAQPPQDFGGPLEAFTSALEHEQKVTASIHELYELTTRERDFAAQVELQWFVNEQVEEEKTATDIVDRLRLAGDNDAALLLLDQQLGARSVEAD